jgi:hypothetical protein
LLCTVCCNEIRKEISLEKCSMSVTHPQPDLPEDVTNERINELLSDARRALAYYHLFASC